MPSLAGVLIFVLIPFADTVLRSFRTAVTGQFCGVSNYLAIFDNQAFLLAVKNTVRFVVIGLPLLIGISLLLSLALNRCKWMQMLKSCYLFPLAVPTATLVLIWRMLFHSHGLLNEALMGAGAPSIDWLGSDAAFWVLIISYLWKNTGYTIILWLAGLQSISTEQLEAARVDGATGRACFFYVMMPQLKPVLYTITILSFLNSFRVFREAYLVAGAYPKRSMYLLQHLFNNWFTNLDVDKMAAAGVCVAVVFAGVVLLLQLLWDRREEDV